MVIRNTVFRDNLVLELKIDQVAQRFDWLASFIKEHKGCGIVYCVFTSDVTKIHAEMIKRDINCAIYYGQLSDDVKLANFNKWNIGESSPMIANAAFGLGIDKSDVR
jgi:ATP-dependent DNA helicase RecQ